MIIERHNAQQYTLSIRVSADGFCFAVHHPQRADEYAFQPYAPDPLLPVVANLRQAREALPMLQHHYACVQLLLADAPYEVIPAPFAGAETADDAPALMDDGGRTPVTIRFAPDSSLSAWVRATWPDARIVPGIWPVVRFALRFGLGVRGERLGLEAATYTPNPSPLTSNPSSPPSGGVGGGYYLCLSADQQERFVRHFKYLMRYYVALDDLGEEAVPIIRRRAVDARRILMIWSLCRRTEELYRDSAGKIVLPADGLIRPTDDDVVSVLMVADYLVSQSVFMHQMVVGTAEEPKPAEKPARRSPLEHLKQLTNVFTLEEANLVGKVCAVTPQTTKARIVRWIGQGFISEVGDGVYKKLKFKR